MGMVKYTNPGRDVLKTNEVWQVGDGRSINALTYAWIPGISGNRVRRGEQLEEDANFKVAQLIDTKKMEPIKPATEYYRRGTRCHPFDPPQ